MKSGEINSLFKNLSKVIKNPKSDLKYKNKFTLLVSVVLSAQCTDVNVNNVTKNIYPKYNKPEHFVKLGRKKIEKLIKKIGIFRIKAKNIYKLSKLIVDKFLSRIHVSFAKVLKDISMINEIIKESILLGGSSLKDFSNTEGKMGYFQNTFSVYGREGELCVSKDCDQKIVRIVQSGRSTFYCPKCQK